MTIPKELIKAIWGAPDSSVELTGRECRDIAASVLEWMRHHPLEAMRLIIGESSGESSLKGERR